VSLMEWYVFAILSLIAYTIQGLILKYTAREKLNEAFVTIFYLSTVSFLSVLFIAMFGVSSISLIGIVAAVANGILYSINLIARLRALRVIPASIFYPIIRLNNAAVVVLLIIFLKETITLRTVLGIIFAVISIYLLSQGEKSEKRI